MRNLLALVGLLVVAFVAAGWYLGWYKIGRSTDAQGKPQLNIQVNPDQIKNDLNKATEQGSNFLQKNGSPPPAPPQPTSPTIPPPPPWSSGGSNPFPPPSFPPTPPTQQPVSQIQFPGFPNPQTPTIPVPQPPPQQSSGWLIVW